MLKATLTYHGDFADGNLLDFYDASHAMVGFQRTLALTTHLVLHNEIITQAPSLRDAEILLGTLASGSFKIPAFLKLSAIAAGLYTLGSTSNDNPIGHLVYSAYDYVVSQSLGFNIDYDESLGETYDRLQREGTTSLPILQEGRIDSLIEKVEPAIIELHRPVVYSRSADRATIEFSHNREKKEVSGGIDRESYEFISETRREFGAQEIKGKVSSYNINTFKGRVFSVEEGRPIPFELAENVRSTRFVRMITASLRRNAVNRDDGAAELALTVLKNVSRSGKLKSYYVVNVDQP